MQTKPRKIIQLAISILVAVFVRIGLFDFLAIAPEVTIFSDQYELGPTLISAIVAACVGGITYYIFGKTEVFRKI